MIPFRRCCSYRLSLAVRVHGVVLYVHRQPLLRLFRVSSFAGLYKKRGGSFVSITVREALTLAPLDRGVLVAGKAGLDNLIRWVTIVEVLEDASRLQEGELLVTTAYELEHDLDRRATYVADLADRRLAGLAILTGFYIKEVPPEIIQQADEHGLPVIQLPSSLNFSDITRALLERIVNRQYELLHASESVHRELTEQALGGGDQPDIVAAVARWTGGRVLVCDRRWNVIAGVGSGPGGDDRTLAAAVRAASGSRAPGEAREFSLPSGGGRWLVCLVTPIKANDRAFGALVLVKPSGPILELDRVALGHASTVSALLFMAREAVAEEARRLRGDVLAELLVDAGPVDRRRAVERARGLGCDLTRPHAAVVFRRRMGAAWTTAGEGEIRTPAVPESQTPLARGVGDADALTRLVEEVLSSSGRSFLLREQDGVVLSLVAGDDDEQIAAVAAAVADRWADEGRGGELIVGVGPLVRGAAAFAATAEQAQEAASLGQLLVPPTAVVRFAELGPFRLLGEMERRGIDLEAAYQASLGELAAPGPRARRLRETLEAFLRHNGNLQATAAALYVHRHTLRYRLARIEALTGRDLRDPLDRLDLHLGVILYRLAELRAREQACARAPHST